MRAYGQRKCDGANGVKEVILASRLRAHLGEREMDTNHRRARNRRGRLLIAAGAVAWLVAVGGSPASADTLGRTEGDARAAFQALAGAGFTLSILETPHGQPNGSPLGGETTGEPEDVRIYPREPSSYCASGWHVIALSSMASTADWETHDDMLAFLSTIDFQYKWDGIPLVEERTAVKHLNDFDSEAPDQFMFSTGTFMPPGSLTVGKHTLTTSATVGMFPQFNDTWSVKVTILPC